MCNPGPGFAWRYKCCEIRRSGNLVNQRARRGTGLREKDLLSRSALRADALVFVVMALSIRCSIGHLQGATTCF